MCKNTFSRRSVHLLSNSRNLSHLDENGISSKPAILEMFLTVLVLTNPQSSFFCKALDHKGDLEHKAKLFSQLFNDFDGVSLELEELRIFCFVY